MKRISTTSRRPTAALKLSKAVMPHKDTKAWIERRDGADDDLYDRYGKPFEEDHAGEFVAISDEGQTIIGDDIDQVVFQATGEFGSGNFAVRKIGYPALGKWLEIAA